MFYVLKFRKHLITLQVLLAQDNLVCSTCQQTVIVVKGLVRYPYDNESMKQVIEFVCKALGPYSPICISFVRFSNDITHFLVEGLSEKQICYNLNLCDSSF